MVLLCIMQGYIVHAQNYNHTQKYFEVSGNHVGKYHWKKGFSVNPNHGIIKAFPKTRFVSNAASFWKGRVADKPLAFSGVLQQL